MGLKMKEDIEAVHRLGKKMAHRSKTRILQKSKENFPRERSMYKNIYINDHITDYQKGLFYEAKKLYRANKVIEAWTQNGNVLIRKNSNPMGTYYCLCIVLTL